MTQIEMTGEDLRETRKRLRLNQGELGRVVGVHWTRVSAWERTGTAVPHHAALIVQLMDGDPMVRDRIERMVGLR